MKALLLIISLYTLLAFGVLNSSHGKNTNFNYNAKNISNYFSASLSFGNHDHKKSHEFFKQIRDPNKDNSSHASKHIRSLINLNKFNEAVRYSRVLENKKKSNFESRLILGLNEFKNRNFLKANIYFDKLELSFDHQMVFNVIQTTLKNWTTIEKKGIEIMEVVPEKYNNFTVIQSTLAHCYFGSPLTEKKFLEIVENNENNFSRYYFFYANYLSNKNNVSKATEIINFASQKYPKNLLINQYKKTINKKQKNYNKFDCSKKNHIVAEIFYVIANALSTQGNYELSNFYVNLSKYLNPAFLSYESLIAENLFILKKYNQSQKIYNKLSTSGSVYKWYSDKQISYILYAQKKEEESLNFLKKSFESIKPDVYEIFDFANFLKNNKDYEKSIELYSKILTKIDKGHRLFPKVLDRRGTAYELIKKWDLAERDLLSSLEIEPNQPYVINYLAYSWVEQGKNLSEALDMLKEANDLKKNDGYITDSLGWAYYKLNKFVEAKKYLVKAITLMPSDPIINDHFADCLWKNNQKIQARYYWNYVLTLESTEDKLKKNIENKLIFGL